MPVTENFRGLRPVILPIPESPNSRPQELAQPQRLDDILEFAQAENEGQRIAMRVLDSDALPGLTFDQKKKLLIYYVWQHDTSVDSRNISSSTGISYKDRMQAIHDVSEKLEDRYESLVGMAEMINEINKKKKPYQFPTIGEFDYWVYQAWLATADSPKDLISRIPSEFQLDNLGAREKIKKIHAANRKLIRYGVMPISFRERRQDIRRERIRVMINNDGKTPEVEDLASQFKVDVATIMYDLAALRLEKAIPDGRKFMTDEERSSLAERIKKAVKAFETEGRSYAKGDIGPAEIARNLEMEVDFVRYFLRRYRVMLGLPKRENPLRGRRVLRNIHRQQVKTAMEQDPTLSLSELYKLVKQNDPKFPRSKGTVGKMIREIRRESEQSQESERVLAEDVSQTVV